MFLQQLINSCRLVSTVSCLLAGEPKVWTITDGLTPLSLHIPVSRWVEQGPAAAPVGRWSRKGRTGGGGEHMTQGKTRKAKASGGRNLIEKDEEIKH